VLSGARADAVSLRALSHVTRAPGVLRRVESPRLLKRLVACLSDAPEGGGLGPAVHALDLLARLTLDTPTGARLFAASNASQALLLLLSIVAADGTAPTTLCAAGDLLRMLAGRSELLSVLASFPDLAAVLGAVARRAEKAATPSALAEGVFSVLGVFTRHRELHGALESALAAHPKTLDGALQRLSASPHTAGPVPALATELLTWAAPREAIPLRGTVVTVASAAAEVARAAPNDGASDGCGGARALDWWRLGSVVYLLFDLLD
jgi:hypothetical protein